MDTPTSSLPNSDLPEVLCRHCGLVCATNPAKQLGIHISCIGEAEARYKSVRIPSPRYGSTTRHGRA